MARSRTTFATIDAAAMDRHSASPPMMQRTPQTSGGSVLPSTSARSGGTRSRNTARAIASMLACRMFRRAMSRTEAAPTPISAPLVSPQGDERRLAFARRELLGIVDRPGQSTRHATSKDHRGGDHRPRQWATASLIHAGNPAPMLRLEAKMRPWRDRRALCRPNGSGIRLDAQGRIVGAAATIPSGYAKAGRRTAFNPGAS